MQKFSPIRSHCYLNESENKPEAPRGMISKEFLNIPNEETATKLDVMISKVDGFRLGYRRFRYSESIACSKRIAFEVKLKL